MERELHKSGIRRPAWTPAPSTADEAIVFVAGVAAFAAEIAMIAWMIFNGPPEPTGAAMNHLAGFRESHGTIGGVLSFGIKTTGFMVALYCVYDLASHCYGTVSKFVYERWRAIEMPAPVIGTGIGVAVFLWWMTETSATGIVTVAIDSYVNPLVSGMPSVIEGSALAGTILSGYIGHVFIGLALGHLTWAVSMFATGTVVKVLSATMRSSA